MSGAQRTFVKGNEVVVPVDDKAALWNAVVALRDDPGKRGEMGERSREIALGYSWERVAEEYLRLYREVGHENHLWRGYGPRDVHGL